MSHYFTDNRDLEKNRKEHSFRFSGRLYNFITDNGVFSKKGVDYGTRALLEALEGETLRGPILDLGCGYGAVGIVMKSEYPAERVVCADINPRAAELTEENCRLNRAECEVYVSDGFAQLECSFRTIITNPPIRAGKAVIYRLFEESFAHLEKDGVLYVVIRKQQGAESAVRKLTDIFGNCERLEQNKGYWILKSIKLTY